MITILENILSSEQLAQILDVTARVKFQDGAATAGWYAREVKVNEQAQEGQEALIGVQQLVANVVQSNPTSNSACLPNRLSVPVISRYGIGMAYGAHIDDAIRGGNPAMRADISYTLFLSDPNSYDGGELVIVDGGGERRVKLSAGSVIFYPSDTLHWVNKITEGERIAAVGWIQSVVRDPKKREVLFDLDISRRETFDAQGKNAVFDRLAKSYSNLLRMWGEV